MIFNFHEFNHIILLGHQFIVFLSLFCINSSWCRYKEALSECTRIEDSLSYSSSAVVNAGDSTDNPSCSGAYVSHTHSRGGGQGLAQQFMTGFALPVPHVSPPAQGDGEDDGNVNTVSNCTAMPDVIDIDSADNMSAAAGELEWDFDIENLGKISNGKALLQLQMGTDKTITTSQWETQLKRKKQSLHFLVRKYCTTG